MVRCSDVVRILTLRRRADAGSVAEFEADAVCGEAGSQSEGFAVL